MDLDRPVRSAIFVRDQCVAFAGLALQALVATYAANKTIVDESATRAAVAEVTAE